MDWFFILNLNIHIKKFYTKIVGTCHSLKVENLLPVPFSSYSEVLLDVFYSYVLRFSYFNHVWKLFWFVFFSCWFHKCPQKSILTYIPEVMWYLLWCFCSSTILAAKLDLLVVYRLFGSVCTIENEHTVFTPMIACL